MAATKRAQRVDEGLTAIEDWHAWFVKGHTERLADLGLPREEHDQQLAEVVRLAQAITDRMRSDYLTRRGQV